MMVIIILPGRNKKAWYCATAGLLSRLPGAMNAQEDPAEFMVHGTGKGWKLLYAQVLVLATGKGRIRVEGRDARPARNP